MYNHKNLINMCVGDFFNDVYIPSCNYKSNLPKYEFKEEKDKYILELEVPRYSKDDISVEYQDNTLIVKGKIDKENLKKSFEKRFLLENVEAEKIGCKLENGILTVNLPKKMENPKTFRIPIA